MFYSGFADEAGAALDIQLKATKALGWKHIETRKLFDGNLAWITDEQFDQVRAAIDKAGVTFNCFGSGVGNWATAIEDGPEKSYEEVQRAIPRMKKLGIRFMRIMSFPVKKDLSAAESFAEEAIKRMKTITAMTAEHDIVCLHENCSGWGSLSHEHSLRLVEAVNSPYYKLVFDTGNCVFDPDVRGNPPYKKQDSWEFYQAVKKHIVYVHIKDGYLDKDDKPVFTFPGEGHGHVRKIVKDLLASGYDGGFSMEPHMAVVHHDPTSQAADNIRYDNYVEYGRRFMRLIDEVKAELKK